MSRGLRAKGRYSQWKSKGFDSASKVIVGCGSCLLHPLLWCLVQLCVKPKWIFWQNAMSITHVRFRTNSTERVNILTG